MVRQDLDDIRKRLEQLAGTLPYKDDFHLGMNSNHNAIELEFGQMILGAVLDTKPQYVVELGTGPGYSTVWILLGLEKNDKGQVWSLDPAMPQPPVWDQVKCPFDRLTYINGTSSEFVKAIPPRIDFLFHDASHCFHEIYDDLMALIPRIPVGGIIMVHDVNYCRNMGDMVAEWFDSMPDQWDYQEISASCGMGIAKRKSVIEGEFGERPKER